MASLSIVFTDRANPRFIRVEFAHDDLWSRRSGKRERFERLAPQSPRLTAGAAAITLLTIRARLSLLEPNGGPARIELVGRSGTPASSLHGSLEKLGQDWHGEWFGFDANGEYLIAKCFLKSEPEGQSVVWLNEAILPRDQMVIAFDGEDISSSPVRLRELERAIGNRFWKDSESAEPTDGAKSPRAEHPVVETSREIRIAILRGGDLSYVSDIVEAFKDRLKDLLGRTPDYLDRGGSNALRSWDEYSRELTRQATNIVDARECDYYVAVGTQACAALRDALGTDRLGRAAKFLFLGVTSPIKMGLVDGLQHRDDELEIAGVSYNDGEVDAMVQRMFKRFLTDEFFRLNPQICSKPRLTFTYCCHFQQDVHQAVSLRGAESYRANQLEVRELPNIPAEGDLDADRVLFGWFTFEVMFQEDRRTRELLSQRTVIATTRASVKNGWASMGVSGDDREIGHTGAEMLVKNFEGGEPLGRMPVPSPRLRHWVHLGAAKRMGLVLPREAIETAAEVFD